MIETTNNPAEAVQDNEALRDELRQALLMLGRGRLDSVERIVDLLMPPDVEVPEKAA